MAYWLSDNIKRAFETGYPLGNISSPRKGNSTSNNDKFLRYWPEVKITNFGIRQPEYNSSYRWYPYNKGGGFLKWYGHNNYLIDWQEQGKAIREIPTAVIANEQYFFKPGLTWGTVTSANFSIRWFEDGYIFDNGGCCIFDSGDLRSYLLALLNSKILPKILGAISPTLNFQSGDISKFPVIMNKDILDVINQSSLNLLSIGRINWDSYEISWDFSESPIIRTQQPILEQAFNTWQQQNADAVAEMKRLEEENNKLFIDAYGLQNELTPDVPDEQITLTRADREKDSQRLVSYAIGCMMGRYSLDEPGLIYAHAGNQDFDASRYQTFPADADGIIPLTEMHWFEDDAAHRIQEFLTAVWGKDTLDANMQWLAESLDKKANETAEDTIRRYLASKFYKDHMQTYKKRPIYWLFSSGKQGAFQALVYLHRYNESTLARMRTEYVMPLISKMSAMANSLQSEIENSDSAAEIKRKEKELQNLHKQQAELSSFEEKLRHYADQRISLDLDDGVKVNYGKFGGLLAEVKAVTGEK